MMIYNRILLKQFIIILLIDLTMIITLKIKLKNNIKIILKQKVIVKFGKSNSKNLKNGNYVFNN